MKIKTMIAFLLVAITVLCLFPASSFAIDIPWYLGDMETGAIELSEDSLGAVLTEYADIVGNLLAERKGQWWANSCTGSICDYDGDGYPALVLLYDREYADTEYPVYEVRVVCRSGEGQLAYLICRLGLDSGNPMSTIYLAKEDGKPMLHLMYQNQNFRSPPTVFVSDIVTAFGDGKLSTPYILKWQQKMGTTEIIYEVNGKEDPVEYQRIFGNISEMVCDLSYGKTTSLSDLQYQILHYADK